MPWAITSSSSMIRTFGHGPSLASDSMNEALRSPGEDDPERELKLDVEPGLRAARARREADRAAHLHLDLLRHAGARLLRSGITLRRRVEKRKGVWQLKLPSDDGRFELEEQGGPSSAARLSRPARRAPARRRARRRWQSSVPAGRRRGRPRADRIEVVVDTVAVLDGARVVGSFVEVEAEVVKGEGARLERDRQGAAQGGRAADGRGSRSSRGCSPSSAGAVPRTATTRSGACASCSSSSTRRCSRTTRASGSARTPRPCTSCAWRQGGLVRCCGRHAGSSPPSGRSRCGASWPGSGGLLGPVRDLDVLLEHLDAEAGALEGDDARAFRRLRARLAAERDDGRAALLEAMGSARYFRAARPARGSEHSAPQAEDAQPLADDRRRCVRVACGRP